MVSVLLTILPFTDDLRTEGFINWYGGEIPEDVKSGRFPTPNEWENVMRGMTEYRTRFGRSEIGWTATLMDDDQTHVLHIVGLGCASSPDQPCSIRCEGDIEVLKRVLKQLPISCGTFLFTIEGEEPELITAKG